MRAPRSSPSRELRLHHLRDTRHRELAVLLSYHLAQLRVVDHDPFPVLRVRRIRRVARELDALDDQLARDRARRGRDGGAPPSWCSAADRSRRCRTAATHPRIPPRLNALACTRPSACRCRSPCPSSWGRWPNCRVPSRSTSVTSPWRRTYRTGARLGPGRRSTSRGRAGDATSTARDPASA